MERTGGGIARCCHGRSLKVGAYVSVSALNVVFCAACGCEVQKLTQSLTHSQSLTMSNPCYVL